MHNLSEHVLLCIVVFSFRNLSRIDILSYKCGRACQNCGLKDTKGQIRRMKTIRECHSHENQLNFIHHKVFVANGLAKHME